MHTSVRGIIQTEKGIVLIHRIKPQEDGKMREYYVLPGGKMEPGESESQTVKREILEELGIIVEPIKRVMRTYSKYDDSIQILYMCKYIEGIIGTGRGPEFEEKTKSKGLFEPVIIPVEEIKNINLVPENIKDVLIKNNYKRHYSYFIVKPDGIRYLNNICKTIESKFQSVKYYGIQDFEQIIKKLYFKHYAEKGEKFSKAFESYLYGLKEIFGNYGVLILVSEENTDYDILMKDVLDTKTELRQAYVNSNIGILTNYGNDEENYVRLISKTGEEKSPRIMKDLGSHRVSDMNVIHCPDSNQEDTVAELKILFQEGLIDDCNMISKEMMEKMIKYTTAKFQDDMKEEDYEGIIQPDISTFILKQFNETEFYK